MRKQVDKVLAYAVIFLMAAMVINVLWQVTSRYVFGAPSLFTDELANFQLIWVGLLGAAYATGQGAHLAIDLLPNKLVGRKKRNLTILINLLVIVFAATVMIIGGIRLVYITLSLDQLSATLQVPLGYVYLVLPLSGAFIVYYALTNILTPTQ